jgi:hypothetical protein
MATAVGLVIATPTPSRLVVATYADSSGLWQKLWGKPLVDRSSPPIESWDFDQDAGTLTVTSVANLGTQPENREVSLATLTRLRVVGVQETSDSDGYRDYELQLFYDDGSPLGSLLTLPSSTKFRLSWASDARSVQSRLRAFLEPACPKLEGTFLQELGGWFVMGHQQRKQLLRERVGKLQAALEALGRYPQAPGMDLPGATQKLQQLQDRLSQDGASPALNQAESRERPTGKMSWLIPVVGAFLAGFLLFFWLK